jgi:hypothetical protein
MDGTSDFLPPRMLGLAQIIGVSTPFGITEVVTGCLADGQVKADAQRLSAFWTKPKLHVMGLEGATFHHRTSELSQGIAVENICFFKILGEIPAPLTRMNLTSYIVRSIFFKVTSSHVFCRL